MTLEKKISKLSKCEGDELFAAVKDLCLKYMGKPEKAYKVLDALDEKNLDNFAVYLDEVKDPFENALKKKEERLLKKLHAEGFSETEINGMWNEVTTPLEFSRLINNAILHGRDMINPGYLDYERSRRQKCDLILKLIDSYKQSKLAEKLGGKVYEDWRSE